jgi:hypothetical protein
MDLPPGIAWRPWEAATFEEARRGRKPLFINVAAGWCHWCHVMDATTFADPAVQTALAGLIAIRVDADARPDLAERYGEWGWPANILLTPDAQPFAQLRGHQEKGPFAALLADVAAKAKAGKLEGQLATPLRPPVQGDLARLRDRVADQLAGFYDRDAGGWGGFQKYPHPGPLEQAWLMDHRGEEAGRRRALRTLGGMLKLLDPVWGGCAQYSTHHGWDTPHFEKIAAVQAAALASFTQAWRRTGDARFRRAADGVRDYVLRWLATPDGPFMASQDADATRPDGSTVEGDRYWRLGDRARRKLGLPGLDRGVYADWNGQLVHALCGHAGATGDRASLLAAARAARRLLATHQEPSGAFRHGIGPDRLLHLRDNAAMGRALVALAQGSGDEAWLAEAERVARWLLATLAAPGGGFFAHMPDPAATGIFAQRRRPLEENGLAARFLLELAWRTQDEALAATCRSAAESAVRASGDAETVRAEANLVGQFLMAAEWLLVEPTKVVLVGAGDGDGDPLWAAALALDVPGLVVRRARPDEYPARPSPAAYLCRGNACGRPVPDAAGLAAELARLP